MVVYSVLLVAILGLLLGFLLVKYLTVYPTQMSAYLLAACAFFFAIVGMISFGMNGGQRWVAVSALLVTFLTGYAWTTRKVLSRKDDRPIPVLTRQRGDRGKGHAAVVYFTHGEPEMYDPIGWINQFRERVWRQVQPASTARSPERQRQLNSDVSESM